MINNLKILCQGFTWPIGTPIPERSFFSDTLASASTREIDLVDFLLDIGDLHYKFEDTDNQGGANQHFFESGNITLKLDGAVFINSETPYMRDFFKIKEDTSYTKYKVRLYYNDDMLFQGTVHQDGLKEMYRSDNDDQTLECLIVGFEKEWREYYRSKPLLNAQSYHWPYEIQTQIGTFPIYLTEFWKMLRDNTVNSFLPWESYNIQSEVGSWYISKHPVFKKTPLKGTWRLMQGYERCQLSGQSVYDWFETICNCMGWIYYFYRDKFYIRTRAGFNLPEVEYDYGLITAGGYDLGKLKPMNSFDNIMLIRGVWKRGRDRTTPGTVIDGPKIIIIGDKYDVNPQTWVFDEIEGTEGFSYFLKNRIGYKYSTFSSEDNTVFNIANIFHPAHFEQNIVSIRKDKMLRLNTGSSGISWWSVRLDVATDGPYDDGVELGQEVACFTGCNGEQLCKVNLPTGRLIMGYDKYVQTPDFRANFAKFLNSSDNICMPVQLDTLVTNPFHIPRFINSGDSFLDSARWGIQAMSFDLKEDLTKFELIKKQ